MQALGRPRAAAAVPIVAVASAAALLFLVAVSIALQPPATAGMGEVGRAMAWAQAIFFSAGAAAFLIGIIAFARAGRTDEDAPQIASADAGLRPWTPAPLPARGSAPHDLPARPRASAPTPAGGATTFTLIAVGPEAEDARAIADFADAAALLATLRAWHRRFPEEEVRIFGPGGVQLAQCTAAPPAARTAPTSVRPATRPRARVAVGGA